MNELILDIHNQLDNNVYYRNFKIKFKFIPPSEMVISGKTGMYTLTSLDGNYSNTPIITADSNFTHNCQLSVIGNASYLSNFHQDTSKLILKTLIKRYLMKNIIMLDINQIYEKYFLDVLSDCKILLNSDYVSTNNSKMKIILFDVRHIKDNE